MEKVVSTRTKKEVPIDARGPFISESATKVLETFAGDSAKDQLRDWGVGPGNLLPNAGRKLDER
jgi:hypothetical protein